MSTPLKSLSRADNTDPHGVEWQEYAIARNGPGQWDELSAVLEGHWASPAAAEEAVSSKRIHLPGMSGNYAFYPADGTVRGSWGAQGRVRVEISAPGLRRMKVKKVDGSAVDAYSLTNVTAGPGNAPLISGHVYDKLNFRTARPYFDAVIAYAPAPLTSLAVERKKVATPLASHWAALAVGERLAAPGPNPFTGGDLTTHYPSGWWLEVQAGDSIGGGKLVIATFRFTWQWPVTL